MRYSDHLKGYKGTNPFHDSQSRMYGDERIAAEFSPTSTFWSLFNEQHEILLGTRGSGKTVLLRMLSFSCLRQYAELSKDRDALRYVSTKSFIGFYIPMHLEFAAGLPSDAASTEEQTDYFHFAFNCMAAQSLLTQVSALLADCAQGPTSRLEREAAILESIGKWWFPKRPAMFPSLADVRDHVSNLYSTLSYSELKNDVDAELFVKPILRPILHILPIISRGLGLDPDSTRWMACIDEAEFLREPYLKCINTFLRDEKKPLVIKMATLPFRHSTRTTIHEGVEVEPNGNDYNYRCIDMKWNSNDFRDVTDHITRVRLARAGINESDLTLSSFVGVVGNDEPIDYFRAEMKDRDQEWSEEQLLEEIVGQLGAKRRERFESMRDNPGQFEQPMLKKFRPIYFIRKMRHEDSKGNRTVGWFAGAGTIRRVADGNPRTFIQIMNILLDVCRDKELTPKNQHRALMRFCQRRHDASEALPDHGVTVKALVDVIGGLLSDAAHGPDIVDIGCHFRVADSLLDDLTINSALAVAIGYSHIIVDDNSKMYGLTGESDYRLSYSYCVSFWLPMRKGKPRQIGSREQSLFKTGHVQHILSSPATRKEAQDLIKQLHLGFSDVDSDE